MSSIGHFISSQPILQTTSCSFTWFLTFMMPYIRRSERLLVSSFDSAIVYLDTKEDSQIPSAEIGCICSLSFWILSPTVKHWQLFDTNTSLFRHTIWRRLIWSCIWLNICGLNIQLQWSFITLDSWSAIKFSFPGKCSAVRNMFLCRHYCHIVRASWHILGNVFLLACWYLSPISFKW